MMLFLAIKWDVVVMTKFRLSIASALLFAFASSAGAVDMPPPVGLNLAQELNSLPRRGLICHQAGKAILDIGNLDYVRLYTDAGGVLRRVDFRVWASEPQTISVSPDTTCRAM
ncbi:hypothetical protein [Magnetospirillum sp. 15-1]|uniref:hypothetical protein n=1 Tax=Magnetospirillum sp. 15-1 TaxID=1979370 RepID=UPI001143B539|nr:hypothetical protein [Magnetospirillum sp. 15-1]